MASLKLHMIYDILLLLMNVGECWGCMFVVGTWGEFFLLLVFSVDGMMKSEKFLCATGALSPCLD